MTTIKTIALSTALLAATALPASAQGLFGGNYYQGRDSSATVFVDPDFRGQALNVNGAIPELSRVRFNDTISSIQIRGGAWEVCTDPNFRGDCQVITGPVGRLATYRLNDNISSIRPANSGGGYGRPDRPQVNPGVAADAVLFEHPRFNGRALPLNYGIANLAAAGFNDNVSSIQIRSGAWQVCTDPDFRGRCEVISRTIPELGDYRLNDTISSIRPVGGSGYGDGRYDRDRYDRDRDNRWPWRH